MRRKEFDTIKNYLAGFETQMNAQFNALHGRLGEIEKRIANPECMQPNQRPVRILDLQCEAKQMRDSIVAEFARYESRQHQRARTPSIRDMILALAEELEVH